MNHVKVKVKLENGAIMPQKATPGSAAYDVYTPEHYAVKIGRQIIPLNIRMEIPDGYEAMIEPRSGFSSKGMMGYKSASLNTENGEMEYMHPDRYDCDVIPGKIDADYRGVIGVIVVNRSGKEFFIPSHTRIAQMTIRKVENDAIFEKSEELSDTVRGTGGFGHTQSM